MKRTKRKPQPETKPKRKPDPVLELKRLTIKQLETAVGGEGRPTGCYARIV